MNSLMKLAMASMVLFAGVFANAARPDTKTTTNLQCIVEGWSIYFALELSGMDLRDPAICGGYMGCEEPTHTGSFSMGQVHLTDTTFEASGIAQPYDQPYSNSARQSYLVKISIDSPAGFQDMTTVKATISIGDVGPATVDCEVRKY